MVGSRPPRHVLLRLSIELEGVRGPQTDRPDLSLPRISSVPTSGLKAFFSTGTVSILTVCGIGGIQKR